MEKKENSKGMPENKKISGTNIMESQSVGYKDRWIEYSETPEIFPQEAVASQSSERNSKAEKQPEILLQEQCDKEKEE